MSSPAISLQLYTLRDAVAADLPRTLDRVAAMGFNNVEPYGFAGRSADYVAALTSSGLLAPSGHAPLLTLDDPRAVLEEAKALGMSMVIDPHTDPERWTDRAEVGAIADGLNALAQLGAEIGVAVGYHNHFWEFSSRIDEQIAFDVFLAALDPSVFLEIDAYWVEVGGQSAPAVLAGLGDRVRLIHVKDGPISDETEKQVAVGDGAMDIPGILAASPDAIRVIELDSFTGDIFDPVNRSIRFLELQA